MVFVPLELHDVLTIEVMKYATDSYITCDDVGLRSARHNLCLKALAAMRKEFGFKEQFEIDIHKEIPYAAGLGGGSSNAACTMLAINKLLNLNADQDTLRRIGLSVGADVPYFFSTGPAYVSGIGEDIAPIKMKESYPCLIVKPKAGLKTEDVFNELDNDSSRLPIDTPKVIEGLESGNEALIAENRGNDLLAPASGLLPEVGELAESLRNDFGFAISGMSGSGSACFALSKDIQKLKAAQRHYLRLGCVSILTRTLL
jgi:4-diphosphocytidyl-2-C-methyl-D-erythritol kinase